MRAFANHGKCWSNGLQHVMINYGCLPSLRACGYPEKAEVYFATLPSLLPLLVLTFLHFSDSRNQLQLSEGAKKRLWSVCVLVSKEIFRTLSHSNAVPLNQNSTEQQIMDNT